MTAEGLRRFLPVEKHMRDARMRGEKGGKIVRRFFGDAGIKASRPHASLQHVPERDTAPLQHFQPFGIGQGGVSVRQRAHDRPEMIAGMGVILLRFQGGRAGHAAENKDAGLFIRDGGKAEDARHIRIKAASPRP